MVEVAFIILTLVIIALMAWAVHDGLTNPIYLDPRPYDWQQDGL